MKITARNLTNNGAKYTELDNVDEVVIEMPNTDGKFVIRMLRDGRLAVMLPEDDDVIRMFIEPISRDSISIQAWKPRLEEFLRKVK